jgi:predicted small lipoprotein YifL
MLPRPAQTWYTEDRELLELRGNVRYRKWLQPSMVAVVMAVGTLAGCHHKKPPETATAEDVAAAQQDARHEVEQAQAEAKKGIKSETKIMGADSKGVAQAKITGAFDVAMARADGDRKVAIEKCLTLESAAQQSCKDGAELDYQSAVAKAKASRASKQ